MRVRPLIVLCLCLAVVGCATTRQRESACEKKPADKPQAAAKPITDDAFAAYRPPAGTEERYANQLTDSEFDKRVAKVLREWNISPAGAQAVVKLDDLDLNKGLTYDEMVKMFGEPQKLDYGGFQYPWGIIFYFENDVAREARIQVAPYYAYRGKIRVGSTVDEVEAFFKPVRVVTGYSANLDDRVLYKDRDGIKGVCWYQDKDRGVIVAMSQNKVTMLSLMRRDAML